MLIHGESSEKRRFIENVKNEAFSFIQQCVPIYRLVPSMELGTSHVSLLRDGWPKWKKIITDCDDVVPGIVRNSSRETGACLTIRYYIDSSETLVYSFNPIINIAISFIQDSNGFRLNTDRYREFETALVNSCGKEFGRCDLLGKEFYSARFHEFGDDSLLDLAFEKESLVYKANYQDFEQYQSPRVLTRPDLVERPLVKRVVDFISDYSITHRSYTVSYDLTYAEDQLAQFDSSWQDFIRSDPNFRYVYFEDKNGYMAVKSIDELTEICLLVSPYLPYWVPFYKRKNEYIEIKEGNIDDIISRVNYFFEGHQMLTLKNLGRGWDGLQNINVGAVLFGRFIGEKVAEIWNYQGFRKQ